MYPEGDLQPFDIKYINVILNKFLFITRCVKSQKSEIVTKPPNFLSFICSEVTPVRHITQAFTTWSIDVWHFQIHVWCSYCNIITGISLRISPYGIESQRGWEEENPSNFFSEYGKKRNNKKRVFRIKVAVYSHGTGNTRRSFAGVILFRRAIPKTEELLAEWKQNLTKVFRFK